MWKPFLKALAMKMAKASIVVITLIVIGTILLFNTSIIDLIKKIKVPKIKHEKKEKERAKYFDICIDSGSLGIDGAVQVILSAYR